MLEWKQIKSTGYQQVMQFFNTKSIPALIMAVISLVIITSIILSLLPPPDQKQTIHAETQFDSPPTTPIPPEVLTLLSKGEQAMGERDYQKAVEYYSQVIDLVPDRETAYTQRSEAYKALSLYKLGMDDINTAMKLSGENSKLLEQRADLFVLTKSYVEAIEDYTKAIEQNPEAGIYSKRSIAYMRLGKNEEALEDINFVIQVTPDQANAYFNRAILYESAEKLDQAIADYSKVIELAKDNSGNAYARRGMIYSRENKTTEALADFEQAILQGVENETLYNERGLIYSKLEQTEQAFADFNKALTLNSQNPNIYYNRGVMYIKLKNFPLAIADYDRAIQLDSNNALYYNNRGMAKYLNNQIEDAVADYNQAIQLNPNYALGYENRANAYVQNQQNELAIQDYTKAIELNPEASGAYYNRGIIYYQLKKFNLALEDFNAIIEKEMPNTVQALNMRALIEIVRNQYNPALDDLAVAIDHDPAFASSYYRRALIYRWMGKRQEAVADLKQYIQLETDPTQLKTAQELLETLDR